MHTQQWDEFRQHDQYFATAPFTPVANSVTNDTETVVNFFQKLQSTEQSIHAIFAAPNEVYKRAIRRLRDGHIDTESFSITRAKTHDSLSEILVLTSQVAASLRFKRYACMIYLFVTKIYSPFIDSFNIHYCRNKMHTTRLSCALTGVPLPEPYSYCSCEVGSLGCAHVISLHFAAIHIQNCARVWKKVRPDQDPLSPEEILSLFPPCIMGAQKTPCRSQYLVKRTRRGKKRVSANRDLLLGVIEEESDASVDEDEDDQSSRDVLIPLEKMIGDWTLKMLNLDVNTGRPRIVSSASEDIKSMKEDVKKYISKFPPGPCEEYEQDFMHEMEYRAMYHGEIPKNNNWGFYLYKTARDRQKRIVEFQRKHTGVKMVFNHSPQQMRSRTVKLKESTSRPRVKEKNRVKRRIEHQTDKKIIKMMRKPIKVEKTP